VRREALAQLAEALGVHETLRLGTKVDVTPAILANAMEALFGAVFIDGGYEAARAVVAHVYERQLSQLDPRTGGKDAKSQLQELMQARGKSAPHYRLLRSLGPENKRTFEVSCSITDLQLETCGAGTSLQRAQQAAAKAMLEKLAP
jgi:ribonuclease-3